MKVWLNGALLAADDAAVSPFDHGLVVGDGVFETLKVVDGVPFALTRHLWRLGRSASGLGIPVPDEDLVREGVAEVIAANEPNVGRLRITVTSGSGPLGSGRGDGGPTVMLLTGPRTEWEPTARVAVCPWVRNERGALTGLKSTSYAENARALAWANERGASEALFANTQDNLCEGTGSNVFVGIGGRLLTPPLSAGCLAGITRELLLEVTSAEELDVPIGDLARVDEAFLASSTRDVQPMSHIDDRTLPVCPGPLTTAAIEGFRALEARSLDP